MSDRPKHNNGKDVPLDNFLYACFEAEKLRKALNQNAGKVLQWPELRDVDIASPPEEISDQDILDLSEDLMGWYCANFPELSTHEPWDFRIISAVTPPLVAMAHDLNVIHKIKTGNDLPEYSFDSDIKDEHWLRLESLIGNFFSKKHMFIKTYLSWSFSKSKEEDMEMGDRPPVGRFAPNFRKFSGSSQSGRGDRRPRGNNDRQGRGGGGGRDRHRDRDRGGGGNDRGGRDRHHRDRDRGENRRHDFGNRKPDVDPAELEQRVMQECDEAIGFMRDNPSENKFRLKPQNSFYRRLQHQKIVDAGFFTESEGEGNDRAVVVLRNAN